MVGIDLATLMELLGHKTLAMTKRCSPPTPEHKKKAVELVSVDTPLDTTIDLDKHAESAVSNVTALNNKRL